MSIDLVTFIKNYKEESQAPILQGVFGNASREGNVLYNKCSPVLDFHKPFLKDVLDIMYKTMIAEHGIGIAANQVGLNLQIFIIESNHEDSEPRYKNLLNIKRQIFINPKIISVSKKLINFWHGCLSAKSEFRDLFQHINQLKQELILMLLMLKIKPIEIFQHEFRHLLSGLYTDHANKLFDTEDLKLEIENGNFDDLDVCDDASPKRL